MIDWKGCKCESRHTIELSSTTIIKLNALDYEFIAYWAINSAIPVFALPYTALNGAF